MTNNLIQSLEMLSKKSIKLLKAMREYMKLNERPVENAYILEKKMMTISSLVEDLSPSDIKGSLLAWLDSQRKEIEQGKDEIKFQFGNRLRELCKTGGIEVRGQYPLLRLGLHTLKLNFELGEATLYFGPEIEKIRTKIPVQAEVIYDMVIKHRRDISTDDAELDELARDIQLAYERCARRDGKVYGEKILIMDVLQEYVFMKQSKKFAVDARRQNFREYPREKMSFMLYQLRSYGNAARGMHLQVATFDATVDKAKALWVPEDEEGAGTHYEYITFEPAPSS
ncbi:MAG: hypothetical protein OEV79_10215 [candidate division WOR-3 bacterium]|nr:hypothetical protein [candidate division WOR-3 bacterium]